MIRTVVASLVIQVALWWAPALIPWVRLLLPWITVVASLAGWVGVGLIAFLAYGVMVLAELGN